MKDPAVTIYDMLHRKLYRWAQNEMKADIEQLTELDGLLAEAAAEITSKVVEHGVTRE